MLWIVSSIVELNSSSDCWADRPSARAREKLAIMPLLRARRALDSSRGSETPARGVVLDARLVEVVLLREGQLEHHVGVAAQLVEVLHHRVAEHDFGLALGRGVDVHLGLDDRHEAGVDDAHADLELLVDHLLDAAGAGFLDDGAHLGAEDALVLGAREERVQFGHGLHDLRAVLDVREACRP